MDIFAKKSSFSEEKRVFAIKELLKDKKMKQCKLAEMLGIEPQNLSRCLCSGKVSEKMCQKISDLFPEYNVMWLLGYSEDKLKEDLRKKYVDMRQATSDALIRVLDSALIDVCVREGKEIPTLDNIPELILLEKQLRDYADSLMWQYLHREDSHVWSYLDNIGK